MENRLAFGGDGGSSGGTGGAELTAEGQLQEEIAGDDVLVTCSLKLGS